MRTIIPIIVAGLVLAACGAPHLKAVERAKRDLVGADTATLERCIGEPQSVTSAEWGETWRYSSAQATDASGRTRTVPAATPAADANACVFDVEVVDGLVARVTSENRAGWGFGSIKLCSRLVSRCVGLP